MTTMPMPALTALAKELYAAPAAKLGIPPEDTEREIERACAIIATDFAWRFRGRERPPARTFPDWLTRRIQTGLLRLARERQETP